MNKDTGGPAERIKFYQRHLELESELAEQCRINGMGSEREARLMARVEELERAARMALSQMLKQADEMPCHYDDYFEAITALREMLGEKDE